jgi:hypothetical protein
MSLGLPALLVIEQLRSPLFLRVVGVLDLKPPGSRIVCVIETLGHDTLKIVLTHKPEELPSPTLDREASGMAGNGRMLSSQPRSSGCRADSAGHGRGSSVRAWSMGLPAVAECRSSMGQGPIFCAAIVIGWPMVRSAKIVTIEHCAGPIRFACGSAESRA